MLNIKRNFGFKAVSKGLLELLQFGRKFLMREKERNP